MSELVLPQFIFSLIQHLREGYNEPGMFLNLHVSSIPYHAADSCFAVCEDTVHEYVNSVCSLYQLNFVLLFLIELLPV